MRYGVAKIKLKNVRIGQADTFFGGASDVPGSCVPFAAAEKISLKRAVDGSTLLKPSKYSTLQEMNNYFRAIGKIGKQRKTLKPDKTLKDK